MVVGGLTLGWVYHLEGRWSAKVADLA